MERWNAVFFHQRQLFVLFLSFSFLKRSGRPFAAGPCANAPRVTAALLRAQTDMAPPSLKGPRALPMSSSQPSSKNIPPGDVLCDVAGEWKALSAALAA